MDEKKAALTQAIAILLSVTPETTVGKLLKLCLESKVDKAIAGKTSMQMAEEFVNQPDSSAYWMQEVIGADGEFKAEEWQALGELGITDTDKFLNDFWTELDKIDLSN